MSGVKQYSLSNLSTIGKWSGKALKEPNIDLMMGLVSIPFEKSDETVENKRYYVSDTELIERRFLKDATEGFDKDADPFSESELHTGMYDCVIQGLGIGDTIKKLTQEKFMSGGYDTSIRFDEIVRSVKTDKYKVPENADKKIDEITQAMILTEAMNVPMIVEDTDIFMNNNIIWDRKHDILYIRKVVDGWLYIKSSYDNLVSSGVIMEPMEKPRKEGGMYKITVRKKVNEILEKLKELKIELNGAKKKKELVDIYCKHIAFPEIFLSMVECKE